MPLDHEDSNFALNDEHLFSKVPIPRQNIHVIDTTKLDDPEAVADDYEKQLVASFVGSSSIAFPRFDLILLGIGSVTPVRPRSVFPILTSLSLQTRRTHVLALPWSPSPERTRRMGRMARRLAQASPDPHHVDVPGTEPRAPGRVRLDGRRQARDHGEGARPPRGRSTEQQGQGHLARTCLLLLGRRRAQVSPTDHALCVLKPRD